MLGERRRLGVGLVSLILLCALAASLVFFVVSIGRPYMGAVLALEEEGWVVLSVDSNGLASQVGIRAGDKPIEINKYYITE